MAKEKETPETTAPVADGSSPVEEKTTTVEYPVILTAPTRESLAQKVEEFRSQHAELSLIVGMVSQNVCDRSFSIRIDINN